MTTKYTFCGCLTSTCTTSSLLGETERSFASFIVQGVESELMRIEKASGRCEWEMKIFKPPFFAAFAISSSHRRPTFNLCSNDRSPNVCTRLLFFFLIPPVSASKIKQLPKICCCCTATTMAKTLSIYSLSLLRWESSATQHRIHTFTLWWWYNWYISPLSNAITAAATERTIWISLFVQSEVSFHFLPRFYLSNIWQLNMYKKISLIAQYLHIQHAHIRQWSVFHYNFLFIIFACLLYFFSSTFSFNFVCAFSIVVPCVIIHNVCISDNKKENSS